MINFKKLETNTDKPELDIVENILKNNLIMSAAGSLIIEDTYFNSCVNNIIGSLDQIKGFDLSELLTLLNSLYLDEGELDWKEIEKSNQNHFDFFNL